MLRETVPLILNLAWGEFISTRFSTFERSTWPFSNTLLLLYFISFSWS